ncbi:putative AlkP superfamily pyrophosphatase or phosphodiesterase [Dyadobacter sp. BE34]|uniref:AlkP superfamily pyrophosphatase or phosphodiesterase n=1 Tax=Dyadobacter fermentans TaxID=94254 RepID=A0ABU1R554_9BACT|nr:MULTISPECIES: alkaline phosphatase family protein [Dyadobacter]MDR6808044.1 putative AlkP superfamily pyrophosphatase or phosphodiesterase [Dyadobacter fermentans]MDR7046140.1 putative AlkP superfamily pyrophosphatase or phosphodiesterase [Dyadobacter sp. BE242]MDR7200453.1 putative AlkP superfamily pyrophosphatase or phosphodiesterase [Dyadobacter sp. BE34]MDR7218413.1 putative AlkP superfamily pyrophosphatase or phosphodiesterase [Dyadobacter sp. BE31]MDR7266344.1 putative AlkP superfamil
MNKTVVIDIVGLSANLIGEHTPFLDAYVKKRHLTPIKPVLPAVTTTSQSTYVTGKWPAENGIVGNGWYDREDSEVKFWKQSNKLVQGNKIWDNARKQDPNFTVSKMFWWYNMYSTADWSVTPRPQYHADGVKAPDCYSYPPELRDELQAELGQFPLFNFWGPNANIKSTRWIADASMSVEKKHNPTLTLIYLPHLDYCLQKFGPDFSKISKELNEIDEVVKDLIQFYEARNAKIILLSEYGINAVNNPIHINRILRNEGLISVRNERWYELLDAGISKAFAVSDHQIAHVYLNDPSVKERVMQVLKKTPGIDLVLDKEAQKEYHIDHQRSGDIVVVAKPDSWFTYYYWLDDAKAPDYAHLVDIHRKPGYDPVEMFMDPKNPLIKLRAGYKLARKLLGFRYLMDVIPLDATLVKGSHGGINIPKEYYPIIITDQATEKQELEAVDVYDVIWKHLI